MFSKFYSYRPNDLSNEGYENGQGRKKQMNSNSPTCAKNFIFSKDANTVFKCALCVPLGSAFEEIQILLSAKNKNASGQALVFWQCHCTLTRNCCCCILNNFSWLLVGIRGFLFHLFQNLQLLRMLHIGFVQVLSCCENILFERCCKGFALFFSHLHVFNTSFSRKRQYR